MVPKTKHISVSKNKLISFKYTKRSRDGKKIKKQKNTQQK